jgi:two-component system, cell cycle sensor histidine kinase and response regulator CckA
MGFKIQGKTALKLVCLLAAAIFATEAIIEQFLPVLFDSDSWMRTMVDALVLVLVTLPFLHFSLFRPMLRLQARLSASEDLFRTTFDRAAVGIAHVSLEGQFLRVNDRWCEIVGYAREELLARRFADITHPEDAINNLAHLNSLLTNEIQVLSAQKRYVHKDSSFVWVNLTSSLLRNPDGSPSYLVSVIEDITERKRAEEELQKNKDLFSLFMKHSPVYTFIKEVSPTASRVLQASDNYREMIGIAGHDMIGKTMAELFPAEFAAKMTADDWDVVSSGRVLALDEDFNGRHYSTIKFPIEQQETTLLAGYTIDITERKRAEEALQESERKYRNLVEGSPDAIAIYVEGRIVFANSASVRQMRAASVEDLLGKPVVELAHPDYRESVLARMKEAQTSGKPLPLMEEKFLRFDGSTVDVEVKAIPMIFNTKPAVQIIVRDITERKQAVDALKYERNLLEALLDNIPDHVYFKDKESRFLRMSRSLASRFDINDPGLAIGKTDFDFFTEHHARSAFEDEQKIMRSGTAIVGAEEKETWPDGQETWVSTTKVPLWDAKGEVIGTVGISRDITERKHAEEAVSQERNLLRTLINGLPNSVYVYVKDKQNRYVVNNAAHLRSLGVSRQEDVLGKSSLDFFVPEQANTFIAEEQNVLQTGIPLVDKEEVVHDYALGKKRWHLTTKVPLCDSTGQIVGLIGMSSDITERKQVDEQLRESETRYRQLVESMPDGVYRSTHEGKFLEVNSALVKILGYESKEDLLAVDINTDLYFASDDRERISRQERFENSAVYRLRRKDGSEIWVEDHGQYITDNEGKVLYHEGVLRDVTDRICVEQELRQQKVFFEQMFTQSSVSTQILDKDGWCERINPKLGQLFGVQPEHIEGKVYNIFKDKAIQQGGVVPHLERVFREGKSVQWEVFFDIGVASDSQNIQVKEKKRVWYQNWAYPIFDEQHRLSHVIIQHIDETERKQAEEALRHAQKLESIGTLAGGIAHDFNNLLNAVLGQTALALGKLSQENPARNHLEKSIKAGERAADLTRQMLAYSGKGKFVTKQIDLNRLVNENIQMLETAVPKTARLRFELSTFSPQIHGDVGQIQQVIMNLIINAGEAIGSNAGYITIRTGRKEITDRETEYCRYTNVPLAPGAYAALQVHDTGIGMSPEVLARIFDPFYTTKFTGRGLGLAAVLGIIRSHSGGLCIESEEGKGTNFEVVLPIVESEKAAETKDAEQPARIDGTGKTILVIDDEPSVIELLKDVFTQAQFTVIGALSPTEGIALYRHHREQVSLVILDYAMPGMDGKATFEQLRRIDGGVKVLLCSGYTEEETSSAFGPLRPSGFIQKPYNSDRLLELVSDMTSA